jgi:hypothetical protein
MCCFSEIESLLRGWTIAAAAAGTKPERTACDNLLTDAQVTAGDQLRRYGKVRFR